MLKNPKKRSSLVRKLTLLLLSAVACVSAANKVTHRTKRKKVQSTGTKRTSKQINRIEKAEEGKSTDDEIRHKWDKVDRSKIGGKEENMTLVQVIKFHGAVQEVIWCRTDNQSTFAMSYEGEAYVSRDHGNKWQNLQPMIKKSTNTYYGISWKFASMVQSPANHDSIIISSETRNSWVTKDCGETWKLIDDSLNLYNFKWHPHNPSKVLAMSRHLCGPNASDDCLEYNILYASKDYGFTWKPIEKFVYNYIWGREAHYSYGIGEDAIFVTKQQNEKKKQTLKLRHFSRHRTVNTYYTNNYFETKKRIVKTGFKMFISRCCLFVERQTDTGSKLVVSEVWNRRFKFMDVNIMDDEDYSEFKVINDVQSFYTYMYAMREVGENGVQVADLLKADYTSANFSLMHRNLAVNTQREIASFSELDAIPGLSIINTYDQRMIEYASQHVSHDKKSFGLGNIDKFIQTKISFNNGASYQYLKPPAVDSNNQAYPPCDTCTLHLHTQESSKFPQVYSHKSAPGILIGVGNVGLHLSSDPAELATFISKDGGLHWREVLKGVHIYEIGDQGGLIVLVPYNQPTNLAVFSHNYGDSFSYIQFTTISTIVTNVVIEPTNNSHQFFIIATTQEKGEVESGIIVHLDFNEYHSRLCKGHASPGDSDSDYERFVPHSYTNSGCILGKTGYYVRKKAEAKCINPDHYEFFHIDKICKCKEDDWECDAGFRKSGDEDESHTCVPIDPKDQSYLQPPENCRMYYYVTTGYRKTADNSCRGGVEHSKTRHACPGGLGIIGLIFMFVLRLVLYGGIIFAIYIGGTTVYDKLQGEQGFSGRMDVISTLKKLFSRTDHPER